MECPAWSRHFLQSETSASPKSSSLGTTLPLALFALAAGPLAFAVASASSSSPLASSPSSSSSSSPGAAAGSSSSEASSSGSSSSSTSSGAAALVEVLRFLVAGGAG